MKSNINYLVIIVIGLTISMISLISLGITNNSISYTWLYRGILIAETTGLFMLFYNGSFINSKYFKYALSTITILIIGSLFSIMHWPFGREIVVSNIFLIGALYTISFLNKKSKKRLDYFKLFLVLTKFIFGSLVFLHLLNQNFNLLPSIIVWLTIIDYLIIENRNGTLLKSSNDKI